VPFLGQSPAYWRESSEKSFLPGSEDKPFESLATQSGGLQRIRTVHSECVAKPRFRCGSGSPTPAGPVDPCCRRNAPYRRRRYSSTARINSRPAFELRKRCGVHHANRPHGLQPAAASRNSNARFRRSARCRKESRNGRVASRLHPGSLSASLQTRRTIRRNNSTWKELIFVTFSIKSGWPR
jgi:hypothetical protein